MRSTLFLSVSLFWELVLALRPWSQSNGTWRDPSPHQVRWITVDSSVRLEVLDWGGSGPPLVLLGCYLTAHVHDEFAPKLTNQFHVYGITRRGIGASDKPATGYTVQRSADDVLEVLDSLKAQKSLLVGNSCAGQVLTMFASQHSDRLSGLVYLDGASDPTTPAYDPPMPDPTTLPRPIGRHLRPISARSKRSPDSDLGVTFPKLNGVNSSPRIPTVGGPIAAVSRDSPGDHRGCEGEAELCGHTRAGAGDVPGATPVRGSGRRVRYP